ncbi:globin C, coelomic-like [Mizuhopecten yessoensis]|uniref:Neuroglobin-1 n=1 Tax=Mizuhopecten yessoensis TaxID=6573 RepID=A0A210QDN4_MIZYE|nr:globin C, coelomic-like [Mizuhopecten yessoensis]XP_021360740.1 globin C, coelomic-like [Mizuhopecten yessoensis]OWF46877.1 Neuroglobin-1 [Mizuhopecten yessoensis]
MGCDVSKSVEVNDVNIAEDEAADFSDNQIDTIRSTWPILSRDMVGIGEKVFFRIFLEEPKIKTVFKNFSYIDENNLRQSKIFIDHVTKFMQVVDSVVDSLEKPKTEIQHTLLMLGAKHATFDGFDIEHFAVYIKVLMSVWETAIGEEFIPEVRESWNIVFTYIVRYLCQGYELFILETELDKPCNGNSSVT